MSRTLRRVLVVLGVGVTLLVIVDVAARVAVERVAEQELRDEERLQAGSVDASVDAFPFLGRLALAGETSFSVRLDDVTEGGVTVDRIELDVDGLVFDRGEALDRRVRVDEVDRVRASVVFEEQTISEAAGVAVELEPGRASVPGVPGSPTAEVSVAGRSLRLGVPTLGAVTLELPSAGYLPCEPGVTVDQGRVELSCTTDALPPVVNEALGRTDR